MSSLGGWLRKRKRITGYQRSAETKKGASGSGGEQPSLAQLGALISVSSGSSVTHEQRLQSCQLVSCNDAVWNSRVIFALYIVPLLVKML